MQVFRIVSGAQSGVYNMALDEALLETVRAQAEPVLVVRTYRWREPTLSLGVNQAVRDINFLLAFYGKARPVRHVVRRPTGGRAILHGEDISYSLITNEPAVLRQSLHESYALLAGIVQQALVELEIPVNFSGESSTKAYLRSPVCFETHTPSDLVARDGHKLTGSAQLRRANGLLQHGAAFLKPYGIEEAAFHQALNHAIVRQYGQTPQAYPMAAVDGLQAHLEAVYLKQAGEILDSAATTSGSHLEPASC